MGVLQVVGGIDDCFGEDTRLAESPEIAVDELDDPDPAGHLHAAVYSRQCCRNLPCLEAGFEFIGPYDGRAEAELPRLGIEAVPELCPAPGGFIVCCLPRRVMAYRPR